MEKLYVLECTVHLHAEKKSITTLVEEVFSLFVRQVDFDAQFKSVFFSAYQASSGFVKAK